ncbi:hypothetical protein M011DRAFT_117293 [Sporormia fimetaria CBS 119925]|uniref:Uncharacterized protein n=1 Tax=Sporormia fimetaria CBS 119925 TaxID=1340428 RepID=A0A6A6VLP2_9PLEO|nr:hypothetical protein M011DRAFT_117293 [Sporormia fimetaria CBS 119925]
MAFIWIRCAQQSGEEPRKTSDLSSMMPPVLQERQQSVDNFRRVQGHFDAVLDPPSANGFATLALEVHAGHTC